MITGKIDLTQLKNIVKDMKGKNGTTKCLILPIDANHLYIGKNGNVYLDLVAFALEKESQFGDTHIVKQSLPKDVREKMTDEEKKAQPILGNMKVGTGAQSSTPNTMSTNDLSLDEMDDDLPF